MSEVPSPPPHRATAARGGRGRRRVLVGAAVAVVLGLAGCGDDDDSGDGLTSDTTSRVVTDLGDDATEGTEAENDDGTVDLTGDGDAPTVEIRAGDGTFEPSTVRVAAGASLTVDFENEGSSTHTFTIEELDIDEELEPGETVSVDVQVPDDGVGFVCRFHEDQGMTGRIEVAADAAGASTTTALTDATGDPGSGSAPEGGTVPTDPGGAGGPYG